ncbi:MAG: hypothetical protein M3552_16365 [Planctomycetota bacterium]|nr:hypothetical protein [Planctomycetota bacterium]
MRLTLLGRDQVRLEGYGISFAGADMGVPIPMISTFDGDLYWSFNESSTGHDGSGGISEMTGFRGWGIIQMFPLTLVLRPLRPEAFGSDQTRWKVVDETVIDGRRCIVLEGKPPSVQSSTASFKRVYIDPERDYVPMRWTSHSHEPAPSIQLDFRYEHDAEPKWFPSQWKAVLYGATGNLREQSDNELVALRLGDPAPISTFQIDFRPGTVVIDGRKGAEAFIIGADGEWIPKRIADAQASYRTSNDIWPWIVGGAAILGILIFIWRRRAALTLPKEQG